MTEFPRQISTALGSLVPRLEGLGFRVARATHSESFGNFEVVFTNDCRTFSVVRDRGQFHVDSIEREALEIAGLWRSFSGPQSLEVLLIAWLSGEGKG